MCHCSCTFQNKMLVLGGVPDNHSPHQKSLFIFDINKMKWEKHSISDEGTPSFSSVPLYEEEEEESDSDDEEEEGEERIRESPNPLSTSSKLSSLSNFPVNFWSNAYTLLGSKLYIFGGIFSHVTCNRMFSFDIEKLIWSEIRQKGDIPDHRYNACMCADPAQRKIYLFGGWNGTEASIYGDFFVFDPGERIGDRIRGT